MTGSRTYFIRLNLFSYKKQGVWSVELISSHVFEAVPFYCKKTLIAKLFSNDTYNNYFYKSLKVFSDRL